MHRQQKNT